MGIDVKRFEKSVEWVGLAIVGFWISMELEKFWSNVLVVIIVALIAVIAVYRLQSK